MTVPDIKARRSACSSGGRWLAPLAGHWIDAARTHLADHATMVRVTVTALRGSAPREPGASMLIDAVGTLGTIGGGRLEWRATALARELLRDPRAAPVRIADLVLGPELGQCCGGRVELWLERLTSADLHWLNEASRRMRGPRARTARGLSLASELAGGVVVRRLRRSFEGFGAVELRRGSADRLTLLEALRPQRPSLWIFGAGHVGQALIRLLADLAVFEITWIDSRAELLPESLPDGVTPEACAAPAERVAAAPSGTRFVVMTHDHALDYELCRAILARADSAWLGLIGSASKSARFRSRLRRDGLDQQTVSGLTCPIGVAGVSSKLPAAIAIAIAAQLLQQGAPRPFAEAGPQGCSGDCGSCASRS
jgi:xanthine dehydrogenase accessory factor